MITKPKVFVSFHHEFDQSYKEEFSRLYPNSIEPIVDDIEKIDSKLETEAIKQKIREEHLKDSTVTVVLIGTQTWKKKHVDWEIA